MTYPKLCAECKFSKVDPQSDNSDIWKPNWKTAQCTHLKQAIDMRRGTCTDCGETLGELKPFEWLYHRAITLGDKQLAEGINVLIHSRNSALQDAKAQGEINQRLREENHRLQNSWKK